MTEASVRVAPLSGHVLAAGGPVLRDHVRPADRRSQHYLDRYDRRTLFYDCVYLAGAGRYLFTAPRFLNLWAPFREGLRVNGHPVRRVRRRRWLRCEQVEVAAPLGALMLDFAGTPVPLAPRASLAGDFAGLNALLAVNKNNPLDWIADWASYHVRAQGAEGVVIFDNGSTAYAPQDVADRLASVHGLRAVAVLPAPYPYGPTDHTRKLEVSPRFFQTAMLNIARRDALTRARAVLSVDIDEIVRSDSGGSVFDAAIRHPMGLITIPGAWVFPPPGTDGPRGHGAHRYRDVPDARCNQKWCLRPGGVMDRFGWAVHRLDEVIQGLTTRQSDQRLLHCKATSTGWKANRFDWPDTLTEDLDLAAFMARHFPPRTGDG